MNCMKCGKEIKEPQVFCDSCLATMEKYPVKSNIRVQVPVRPVVEVKASAKKEPPSLEVQLQRLRRQNKHLFVALLCSVFALALAVVLLFHAPPSERASNNLGRNYTTAGGSRRP